jgi:hypothetical protein
METLASCALNRNPHLAGKSPYIPRDWQYKDGKDNWSATRDSRCERYEESNTYIHLDVDGENYPDEFGLDEEAVKAVEKHSGRKRGDQWI